MITEPRMGFACLILVISGLAVPATGDDKTTATAGEKHHSIQSLSWLAGTWISRKDGEVVEEHWMKPRGGFMLGLGRTTKEAGGSAFEFMRIAETKDGLTFFASPSGKPAVAFPAVKIEEKRIVFENDREDFPRRIIYAAEGDKLTASIEGELQGRRMKMSWTWSRDKEAAQ